MVTRQMSKSRKRKSVLVLEPLECRTLLSAFPWGSFETDEIGNTFRTAHTLELDVQGDVSFDSAINHFRDRDFFVFTASGAGAMQIDVTTPDSDLDSLLFVYSSRGNRGRCIAWDDDSGEGTDARITLNVEAGQEYYIRVGGYRRSTGSYTLVLDGPSEGETYIDDFGDSFEEATVLTLDDNGEADQTGEIGWSQDQDMFVFTAVNSGTMQIDMTTPNSELDSFLFVYDENQKCITWDDDGGEGTDAQVTFEVVAGSQYYIRADAWRYSIGTYHLELSGSVVTEIPPDDGNDDVPDAESNPGDGQVEGWAVLLGAWDYEGEVNDLYECAVDVEAMQSVLVDTYHFDTDSIHVLTGGQGDITSSVIETEFSWLQENADGDDIVFFYYTGHGASGQMLYQDDNESLALPDGEYYTQHDLQTELEQIEDGATKIVVLDTCYSGGFAELSNTVSNTCVLASSAYYQSSWGRVEQFLPEGGRGSVFSSWLVTAMQDDGSLLVDSNQNGQISMREAFQYAYAQVTFLTRGRNYQSPIMSPATGEYEILLTA